MTVTSEVRQEALTLAVQGELRQGGRIESQTHDTAVVIRGGRVNHVLHLLLTLFTLGLWVIVWLILALAGGEKRRIVTVDTIGTVSTQEISKFPIVPAVILGVVLLVWLLVWIR